MGKNNKLINSLKKIAQQNRSNNIAKAANDMTPQIYAAMAIALHRTYGFGHKRINDVFLESQRIWEGYNGDSTGMIRQCERETGITVIGRSIEGESCGNCKWRDDCHGTKEWICTNEKADYFGYPVAVDEWCMDHEY